MKTKTVLILYHKPECPLCDKFELELREWVALHPETDYKTQNIEDKECLNRKYEWRVPVLTSDDTEICFGKFDEQTLDSFMLGNAHSA